MDIMKNETKSGMMIVVCTVLLLLLVFWAGGSEFGHSTFSATVRFTDITGLELNAPVLLSGKEVGRVDDIRFVTDSQTGETKVDAILKLDTEIADRFTTNSLVQIQNKGIAGNKIVTISPGTPTPHNIYSGEILDGTPPVDMNTVLIKLNKELDNFRIKELGTKVHTTTENLNKTIIDLKRLINTIEAFISKNQDEMQFIFTELKVTANNIKSFTRDIKANPWKLFFRTKEKKAKATLEKEGEKGYKF